MHAKPIALAKRVTTSEILVTGIKAIEVLASLERAQNRTARRCWSWQNGANYRDDSQHSQALLIGNI